MGEEQSAGWKMDDWVKLTNDFIKAFDEVDLSGMAQRESAKSTNLRNSQYVVMLHEDSDSGIKHLHIVANRVDMEGNVNDDHCIHERAMIAAFRVSEERRWEQPQEVREGHIKILSFYCKAALEDMESFSWEAYDAFLKAHGYGVEFRRDSNDKITGYTLLWGHSRFKSSILGNNRNLTPSRIQDTWKELHPEKEFKWQSVRLAETPQPVAPKTKKYPQPKPEEKKPSKPVPPAKVRQTITVGYREYPVEIPEAVFKFFQQNAAVPENAANSKPENIIQTAVLLFAGYVDGATTIADNCGGAGSSATDDWGKKKPIKPVPPAKVRQTITVGYREYPVEIPETVYNYFKENAVVPENTLWTKPEHILQTAVLLFAGYVDGATTIADNCGGAGSSATDDWGKKKPDENDMAYAKRCLERAQQLHVRPPRRGMHL